MSRLSQIKKILVDIAVESQNQKSTQEFKSQLNKELVSKFSQLDKPMSSKERIELLSWFVDSMRSEVHEYFDETNLFSSMTGEERINLCADLDKIHQDCADLLFKLTHQKQKGQLVELDETLHKLKTQI